MLFGTVHAGSTEGVFRTVSVPGHLGHGIVESVPSSAAGNTVWQEDPGPVTVILAGSLLCVVVAAGSLAWRAVRRVSSLGVTALVAACVVGTAALLGALTIGPFLVPLAVLLMVVSLPMSKVGPASS